MELCCFPLTHFNKLNGPDLKWTLSSRLMNLGGRNNMYFRSAHGHENVTGPGISIIVQFENADDIGLGQVGKG